MAPCIALGPTVNVQGSVSCYNRETKQVVMHWTITPLPMPNCVINSVLKLGEKCKQKRVGQCIQFLNCLKQQFSWGDGTKDEDLPQLLEAEPHDTDVLPAKLPSVELQDDSSDVNMIQPDVGPNTALTNAKLCNAMPHSKIAGVDSDLSDDPHPLVVLDDEDDTHGNDNDSEDDSEMGFDIANPEQ